MSKKIKNKFSIFLLLIIVFPIQYLGSFIFNGILYYIYMGCILFLYLLISKDFIQKIPFLKRSAKVEFSNNSIKVDNKEISFKEIEEVMIHHRKKLSNGFCLIKTKNKKIKFIGVVNKSFDFEDSDYFRLYNKLKSECFNLYEYDNDICWLKLKNNEKKD